MNCKVQRWESFSPHGYDVKKLAIAIGLTVMGSIANASILWDYGWTMGTETGGWSNSTAFQNFAEKVSFASDVSVTRFMTYTNFDPTSFGTMFVKLLSDIAGVPDAVASWTNVSGDINEVNLDLSTPFTLTAGTTYWIDASGNDFEASALGVMAPGDSKMAQFNGANYVYMTDPS